MSVSATGYSGYYDGEAHGITVDVTEDDGNLSDITVWYAEEPFTVFDYQSLASTEPVTRVDAGTTTVYFLVLHKSGEGVTGSKDIIIAKAPAPPIDDVDHPVAIEGLVDTDADQELVRAPEYLTTLGFDHIEYSVGYKDSWSDWSSSIPTGNDVGVYAVRYRYVGDENHEGCEGGVLYVSIDPTGGASGGDPEPEPQPVPQPAPEENPSQDSASGQNEQPAANQSANKTTAKSTGSTATKTASKLPDTGDDTWPYSPFVAGLGLALVAGGIVRRRLA